MDSLRVSVTSLAQLMCRSGDLDISFVAGPSARDGQKAHQRWQAQTSAATEVKVKVAVPVDDVTITLGGRLDILDRKAHHVTEIKSTLVPVAHLSDAQKALHRAQVRLYAFCLLHEQENVNPDLSLWTLDVLYLNIRDDSPTRETEQLSAAEVLSFGMGVLQRYVVWMRSVYAQHEACRRSAREMDFPFPSFRAGQRHLASVVYCGARDGYSSLCEAPTGIGKTVSTLFPAMKAIGEQQVDQIVYLTAKASGVNAKRWL